MVNVFKFTVIALVFSIFNGAQAIFLPALLELQLVSACTSVFQLLWVKFLFRLSCVILEYQPTLRVGPVFVNDRQPGSVVTDLSGRFGVLGMC